MLRGTRVGLRKATALWWLIALVAIGLLFIARAAGAGDESDEETHVRKTDAEWKKRLTPKQYRVARLGETEPPFRGKYWRSKKPGIYRCVCCQAGVFSSEAKFESGTGWPSFFSPIKEDRLATRPDYRDGDLRTEVLCARCDAHLGHVFADGPPPTGLRFCINSASLTHEETAPGPAKADQSKSKTKAPGP